MRIEQLETIVEVANKGSMHKAAESLHTSTQNISQQIKQLENSLGVKIFIRNKHGVFLTPDGEYVFDKAKEVLHTVRCIEQRYSFTNRRTSRAEEIEHCNILASHSSQFLSSELLKTLCNSFIIESASIIAKDSAEINGDLEKKPEDVFSNYEFVFTNLAQEEMTRLAPLYSRYDVYELDRFRLAVHISTKNPLSTQEAISIRDIIDQPLIANQAEGDYATHIATTLANSGIKLRPKYYFNSASSVQYYVEANMGYGIRPYVSNIASSTVPDGTVLLPLKEHISLYQILLISPRMKDSSCAEKALSILKKAELHVEKLS